MRECRQNALMVTPSLLRSMAVFVYPDLGAVIDGVRVWDHVKGRVAAYLAEHGRPDQVAAWQEGRPYVAELADNSAGQ